MFFKDQDGAQGVVFGDKKVVVANFQMEDEEGTIAGVLLGEGVKNKIVTMDNNQGKDSGEIRTKIRMVFTEIASIDVVMGALQRAKDVLFKQESDKVLAEGDGVLKPEEN